jgi:8-oxo-dGTP pyrophosphatase MutT (NUDIX family)
MTNPADVPVRDASTVMLLRDDPAGAGPQVWMLTRVTNMVFAAGASVFPGGRLDDADTDLPWSGRAKQLFAEKFDCDVDLAARLVGAAVRETFEETGVLLTSPPASLPDAAPEVEAGRLRFADLLAERALAINGDALRPWARWVTPANEINARRYDTRFFVAALPDGAEAADLTSESTIGEWLGVAQALAQSDRGERYLMTPTKMNLTSIADYGTVAEIMAAAEDRSVVAVRPVLEKDAEGNLWAIMADGSRVLRISLPSASD